MKKQLIKEAARMQKLAGILKEDNSNLLNTLYDKVIFYMDNNYSDNKIIYDDIYTIVNDVIIPRNPDLVPNNKVSDSDMQQLINKISKESEYTFTEETD